MKKIVLSLLALAATMNMMAVTYSAKATITLESRTTYESCEMIIGQSDALAAGLNNGEYAEINMEGRSVAMYVEFGGIKYQHFASDATTMTNLPVKVKTNGASKYNLIISNVTGNFTLKIGDSDPINVVEGTTIIDLAANQAELAFGIINYQEPTPACTTVRENMEVGHYYTICLPQEIASFNGASFWNLSKRGTGVAYLEEAELPLVIGQPYIIEAEAEELCVVYGNGVPAASAGAAGALVGTFAAMNQAALDAVATSSDIYLLYDNELVKVNGQSGNNLPANRAYVVYNELIEENPTPAPGRRVRAIPMQEQTATGVENINASEAATKFVENGQIFIRRGNEVFNLQGQVVK